MKKFLLVVVLSLGLAAMVTSAQQPQNNSALSVMPRTFQALQGGQQVLVLGLDDNLWLEESPFGHVPPKRQQVDSHVWTFQAIDIHSIFVLGSDGKLWLEDAPFGNGSPRREQVDANVWTFQALDTQNVLVLGTDGNLWLEQSVPGPLWVPIPRTQVDGNAKAFQALDAQNVLVLGNDSNLWLEQAPFGNLPPPHRTQIDANVLTFQEYSKSTNILVLGTDGNLWLEQPPFGKVPAHRQQVDGDVKAFQATSINDVVWVLGSDGKLWLERGPFGKVPPERQQVDANVLAFQGFDIQHAMVLGNDFKLWLDQGPFPSSPANRQAVEANVLAFAKPGGPYLQSCTIPSVVPLGTTLTAICPDYFGNPVPRMLNFPYTCTGTIQNVNGQLRCVVSKTVVTDSITETISFITWRDAKGTHKEWSIDEPNVVQHETPYHQIRYHPGDSITVGAGGCVQTGGGGKTWKDYVNPIGDQPVPGAYAGQIMLPWTGISGGLHPIAEVVNKVQQVDARLPPTGSDSELYLSLGYVDDNYSDNGYYAHDDGDCQSCNGIAQCRGVGPAWVNVTITTPVQPSSGTQYSPGSRPFDLVWDVNAVDGNGLPFNPRWFAQIHDVNYKDVSVRPDFVAKCGPAFTTSTHWCYLVQSCHDTTEDIGVLAQDCTTQAPTLDVVGANLFNVGDYCHDSGAVLTGHLNWGIVTYDGYTYYNNWSGGFPQDEDFNIALHHSDASGLAQALPGEEPANTPSIVLEVKSLELDPYLQSPFWTKFTNLAESCGGGNPCDMAAGLIFGPAIATGEMGIDGAHAGFAELHPLYSLAVHILPDKYDPKSNIVEEHWEFLIRNQGTEGSCSQEVHSWLSVSGGTDYYVQLPWPEFATSVSAQIRAWPWQSDDKLGKILFTQTGVSPKWTYLQFFLPLGMGSGFDGEVTLTYKLASGAKQQELIRPQVAAAPGNIPKNSEPDWNQVLNRITDPAVKARVQQLLATPPPRPSASHYAPITISPQPEVYKPKPSPASQGKLTRSSTAVDPIATRFSADMEAALGLLPVTFQAINNAQDVFVLGTDSELWLEEAPFGKVPPKRQQVDGNVRTFQALDAQTAVVLGTDGKLWLEQAPFGKIPPAREQVDGNVLSFQALDRQNIFVLGTDGKLWVENAPFGKIPAARQQVDANVRSFQALDAAQVLVVGTDDNLWLEQAPFRQVPPKRQQVDANVWSFFAPHATLTTFVLGSDGKLWLEQPPYGKVPPARQEVDANVHDFRALALLNWIWVLGEDGNLWLEQGPFGKIPPSRKQIDGNVSAFQPIDLDHVLVLGTDGNLWLEQSPFGKVPPARQQVDANVR